MKSILSILTLIAALAMAVPTPSMAAKKKPDASATDDKKSDDKDAKKKDTYPLYGEVVAISDTLLTIKGGKDKPDRKFDITKDTKFKNAKEAATIKDVKKGAWVGGLVKKSADGKGNDSVLSVNVGVKQKEDKKDDKKASTDKPAETKPDSTTKPDATKPDTTKKKKKTDAQ